MLVVREFEQVQGIVNSDREMVATLNKETMVAIYDTKKITDEEVQATIYGCTYDNRIVILPLNVWTRIHTMIKENYEVKEISVNQ